MQRSEASVGGKELVSIGSRDHRHTSASGSSYLLLGIHTHMHIHLHQYTGIPLERLALGLCARQEMQGLAQDGSDSDLCQCPTKGGI